MKKYLLFALAGLSLTSCLDTVVLPKDQITGEDFWKNKEQVSNMVAGAYKSFCDEDVIERFIVWGDFRSDELTALTDPYNNSKENDLKKIDLGNVDYNCSYSKWDKFYQVINRCNIVLSKAQEVVAIDPDYSQSTFNTDESQMKALRALCYFYLVRAFRDVPYQATAVINSSEVVQNPQLAPDSVLTLCINDLKDALQHPLNSESTTSGWRNTGLITRNAINAILADIYLWRASVHRSTADYQQAIAYCDAVINSKKAQYLSADNTQQTGSGPRPGRNNFEENRDYPLLVGEEAYERIFIDGNSAESILEIQLDGQNNRNTGLFNCYWSIGGRAFGLMKVPRGIFGNNTDAISIYTSDQDFRFYENCFNVNAKEDVTNMDVRKMVDMNPTNNSASGLNPVTMSTSSHPYSAIGRAVSTQQYKQNWIIYRLTDVMLMKAEALVQLGDATSLDEAFNLVYEVNRRAMADKSKAITKDGLVSQDDYEMLVMNERQRELCFEGKRWFDLLRYNYRHTANPAQWDKTLYEIAIEKGMSTTESSGNAKKDIYFEPNYQQFTVILQRKFTEGGAAVLGKMATEAHLYLPIHNDEVKVNPLTHQNPVYDADDIYVRK